MSVRLKVTKALLKEEFLDFRRAAAIFSSLLILPLAFGVVLPALLLVLLRSPQAEQQIDRLGALGEELLSGVGPGMADPSVAFAHLLIGKLFAPAFLLIPVIAGSTLAASSFAGEKSERTLEGLLFSPASPRELVLAKVLASLVPAVLLSWLTVSIYLTTVLALGRPVFQDRWPFDWSWFVLAVVLVPLVAFLTVAIVIEVSQRAKSVKTAQSVAGLLILPVIGSIVGQVAGAALLGWRATLAVLAFVIIADCILAYRAKNLDPVRLL